MREFLIAILSIERVCLEKNSILTTTFFIFPILTDSIMAEEGAEGTLVENVEVVVKGDPIPNGKYTVVACDIDTTGKRLIDEVRKI